VPPRFGALTTTLGYALTTVGFGMVIDPSWRGLLAHLFLGLVVGLIVQIARPFPNLAAVLPTLSAVVVTLLATWFVADVARSGLLRVITPALIATLPGMTLVIGSIELAGGRIISGSSRTMYGLAQMGLLIYGVVLGVRIAGEIPPLMPQPVLGPWTVYASILVIAVGLYIYLSAPKGSFFWLLLTIAVANLTQTFAGQALNAGVRDAANVAWKLAAILHAGAPETLIDTYEQERRPHAADMVRLSHRIGKVVMSTNSFGTAFRDGFITATGLVPPLKRWITGMKFLKQPHYASGCLVTDVPGAPKEALDLVGRSLSQPQVEMAAGDPVGLDALLGLGWVSLRFEGDGQFVIVPLTHGIGTPSEARTVTDVTGLFAEVPAGVSLIVRPDRYVAAAVPTELEAVALGKLGEYVPELVR